MIEEKLSKTETKVYQRMLTQTLEWVATAIVVIGAGINALGYHPEGPITMIAGGCVWIIVGNRWKKRSIVVTNSVIVFATTVGLIYYYFA